MNRPKFKSFVLCVMIFIGLFVSSAHAWSYVLNTKTKVFHETDCGEVSKIKAKNRKAFKGKYKEVVKRGYKPCEKCAPYDEDYKPLLAPDSEGYGTPANSITDEFSTLELSPEKIDKGLAGTVWKLATFAKNLDISKYAFEYYKKYFKDGDSVHAIINYDLNTTTIISDSGWLFVHVHERVPGEENNVKKLGSGALITDFDIDKETGKIIE